MLRGNLDVADLRQVRGWAQDDAHPDVPVSLLVTDNDRLLGRILANRYRADLADAGIGSGRHSFEFQFAKSLAPFEKHVLRVRRESDGTDVVGSPVTIEPTLIFDAAAQEALADIIQRSGSDEDVPAKIDFLARQTEILLQQLADRDSKRAERERYRQLLQRWRRTPEKTEAAQPLPAAHRRALVIDDRLPQSDRDAGSMAVLSHMQSLQRLGYEVVFTPATEFAGPEQNGGTAALDAIGVVCCRAPYYGSIEEVLRRQVGEFDLVYLHRVANAAKYGELARYHNPKARQVYAVADLHHVRLERQAAAEDRPELKARGQRLRFAEYVAAAYADAVITHSTREAEALAKQVGAGKVHTVLWSTPTRPTRKPFAERAGVAFIGGYGHEPNLDAARWLIGEIMPLVRKRDPKIECLLVGSNMPEHLRRLCGDGVVAVGYVEDLADIFDRVRLTVAPLTYGAGIKGKVIESLAAGVPCACTPVAAEGFDFPEALQSCVGEGADGLAALIGNLHGNARDNGVLSQAGLDYVTRNFSPEQLDAAMGRVLAPAGPLQPTPSGSGNDPNCAPRVNLRD